MTPKFYSRLPLVALMAAAPLAFSPFAMAQDTASEQDDDHEHADHLDLEEIVITGSPLARRIGQSISAVSVLTGEELAERVSGSIGDTLRSEPGISSTSFGAGASRPIIRGLGGDRIRVLEDGIGTFDAAQTSPDHAVPIEPALAERIEVFRGAASLLYGSSASGGVVNTNTGKIPDETPEKGYEGALRYSHSTVNNADEVAGGLNIGLGNLVIHGEGAFRAADDYEINGITASDALLAQLAAEAAANGEAFVPQDEFASGFVPNTDLETSSGAVGASWLFDHGGYDGFFGGSVSFTNSDYGIPEGVLTEEDLAGEEGGGEEEGEEEGIRIDLKQTRYDLKGELNGDLGLFRTAKFRAGYGDYRHFEVEGEEIATAFENDEIEARLELLGKSFTALGGEIGTALGTQVRHRDFSAIGAEAFVPPSEQLQVGLFGLSEFNRGNWLFDTALRYEHVDNSTDAFVNEEDGVPVAVDTSFDLFSVSGGVGLQATQSIFLGLNASRTERAPSLEELFSFGPHLATQSFEVGDATLGRETARGLEATARGEFGPLTMIVNAYVTDYDNFIFERATGETLDGLPVFQFSATDTRFRGFEAEFDAELGAVQTKALGEVGFAVHGQADFVRATSSDLADPDQPRIPPFSVLGGVSVHAPLGSVRFEVEHYGAQNDIASFELPTESFTFVNMFVNFHPFKSKPNLTFDIRARNLNDARGRPATSFLKDTTPLPGRDIRLGVRLAF